MGFANGSTHPTCYALVAAPIVRIHREDREKEIVCHEAPPMNNPRVIVSLFER
jgi:hypothetical protein